MSKLIDKIKNNIDITIEDLVVCPIDDHMTIGIQMIMPQITVPHVPVEIKVVYINNLIMGDYLIL